MYLWLDTCITKSSYKGRGFGSAKHQNDRCEYFAILKNQALTNTIMRGGIQIIIFTFMFAVCPDEYCKNGGRCIIKDDIPLCQ